MFEVILTQRENPAEWEWRICDNSGSGRPLMVGWRKSRKDAKYEGESALFNLLASGGSIPHRRIGPIRGH